jgi:CelD/BcsL family acetyltransferase involved in cellulose biosynthesis
VPTLLQFQIHPVAGLPEAVRSEWRALGQRLGVNASVLPGWLDVVESALGRAEEPLQALLARDAEGELRGVIPFFLRRIRTGGVRLRSLELASNRMGYHPRIVGHDCETLLDALLRLAPRWDVFSAGSLGERSPESLALEQWSAVQRAPLQRAAGEQSPFLEITTPWESYLADQDKKFRYKLKRRREDHDTSKGWRVRWFEAQDEVNALLADILSIESRSWKAAEGRDIASRDFEARYHDQLLPFLASERMLLAAVLYREATPIAYSLCCLADGWFGHLKTSFDQSLGATSPGGYVIDLSMQRAFECGAREFDFLGDAAPHKLAWTDTTRGHTNYWLYAPRLLPRLVARVKEMRAART